MQIGIAADHRGFELKQKLIPMLTAAKISVKDFGAHVLDGVDDYPDFVIPMALAVQKGEIRRGIAICGSGIGACVAANKVRHVRAGIIPDLFSARQGVEDDDMNVMCLAAHLTDLATAFDLIQCFLNAQFSEAPRHQRRLAKIAQLEEMETQTWTVQPIL